MISDKLLAFINELSDKDTKTLTGKALKLNEETGELASKVLPYDSAAGTKHRFVTRDDIMEEVADVMLVALSIARQLEMDEKDLEYYLDLKSVYWAKLQASELKEDIATNRIPFELHISVEPQNENHIEIFKSDCKSINTKGIILDLINPTGEVFQDWMTSSRIIGDNKAVMAEADRLSAALTRMGYDVIRTKIETVPWHPSAPKTPEAKGSKGYYFEAHIGVTIQNDEELILANTACLQYQAFSQDDKVNISGNAAKVFSDGSRTYMITLRKHDTYTDAFKNAVQNLKKRLKENDIPTNHEVIEYAIFDTNEAHDDRWLNG